MELRDVEWMIRQFMSLLGSHMDFSGHRGGGHEDREALEDGALEVDDSKCKAQRRAFGM